MSKVMRLWLPPVLLLFSLAGNSANRGRVSLGADAPASLPVPNSDLPEDVDRLLWWLPLDTESLIVSKGSVPFDLFPIEFPPSVRPMDAVASKPAAHRFADLVAAECLGPFSGFSALYPVPVQGELVRSFFAPERTAVFCKSARRRGSELQVCDIVLFRDASAQRVLASLAKRPSVSSEFGGVHTLTVDLNAGAISPPDRWFLATPLSSVFLASSSEELMKEVISRATVGREGGRDRALPVSLPEWRVLRRDAMAWAIRHYRAHPTAKDLTSMAERDALASGLVLFCEEKPLLSVALRYVSKADDAGSRFIQMRANWLGTNPAAFSDMQRVGDNCVEERLRINVSREDALRDPRSMTIESSNFSLRPMYLPLLGLSK